MPQPRSLDRDDDRLGFGETRDYLGAAVSRLLPRRLVLRALSISVTTDRDSYAPGDAVDVSVEVRNRFPVPIEVETDSRRRWGWTVDGLLEASDEPRRDPGGVGVLSFRARETKRFEWTWDGLVKHVEDGSARWYPLEQGEHELRAYVATRDERPSVTATFTVA